VSDRRAFTLLEMLVTISIVATAAVLVAPALTDDSGLRVAAATDVLMSDIEYAQVLSLAEPADPIVVVLDAPGNRWWLARASAPETPIEGTNGSPYLMEMGTGRLATATGVSFTTTGLTDGELPFNEMGGLDGLVDAPQIVILLDGYALGLEVDPSTGTVSELGEVVIEEKPKGLLVEGKK